MPVMEVAIVFSAEVIVHKGVHKGDMQAGTGDKDMELVGSPWVALKEGGKWEGGGCSDKSLECVGKWSDLSRIRDGLVEGEVGVVA